MADAFAAIQLEWVRDYPGYRSSRILASVDGTRLYNVIEWADEEAYAHFERVSDTKG
ncbi:hypothetical protein GOARA_028_00450 [Gordonia araii NBRC 100433]|uniref:ABM domain-containing protein n=1 Tax=Gordonia araii NBRC 100433 TaxID=1073574 RepID=G7GZV9_9ACTN|nr:hypothetical protein [Gordonia araii]NNG98751.1 hypothetical protein [Gordonia araii NBRC 100433]GAB09134.1 hypothetical protein GOARA_028_00450 [Gordonia araii NBRC 100433]